MNSRPKFASLLAEHYVSRQVEKRLLGRKFIRLGPLLTVGGFLFETGAILGRAFRDRFDVFAVPYTAQPDRPEAIDWIRSEGQSVADAAANATTINELFTVHEMLLDDPARPTTAWAEWFISRAEARLPVDFALNMGVVYGVRGAGFGSQFPERLEELYVNSYMKQDPAEWHRAFEAGLRIPPEQPEPMPLDEREAEGVAGFAEFCAEYYPELLAPLGLERNVGGGHREREAGDAPTEGTVSDLVARLDEPGRREFIAFTLIQRRPHLHRLFLRASRRAYLHRNDLASRMLSTLAKEIKKKGHEDEQLCRNAAELAQEFSPLPDSDYSHVAEVAAGGKEAALLEFMRAAEGAASAASMTAGDVAALKGPMAKRGAAVLAAEHSISVIHTAYVVDARASGRIGSAVAGANAQVAVEKAQDEQLKWLRKRVRA